MKKKVMQRVLSAILCAAMVFQSVSYEAMASEISETAYEVQSEEPEEPYSETAESQNETTDNEASDDEGTSQTEDSSNEASIESSSDNETETSTVDEEETENTTETETDFTEIETETDAIAVQDDTEDVVTFAPVISFTGFEANIEEGTTITVANPEDYNNIYIYFIQYNNKNEEISRDGIYWYFDKNNGVYTVNEYSWCTESLSSNTTQVGFMVETTDSNSNTREHFSKRIARTNKSENVKFTISDVNVGISRVDAVIDYTGDMNFDSNNAYTYFETRLYYKTDADSDWNTTWGSSLKQRGSG
jgi:hypothetical protein